MTDYLHEHSEFCEVYGCNYYARTEEAEDMHARYWEKAEKQAYEDDYYFDQP